VVFHNPFHNSRWKSLENAMTKPVRNIRSRFGPHSKKLVLGGLDLRTREGKFAHGIRQALAAQLGRPPTAAEQLIIAGAAVKALRMEMLVQRILAQKNLENGQDFHFLAWSNGLRRDLEVLGVAPREPPAPSLARYLLERRKRLEDKAA
jgi:hypothetical protein